MATYDRYSEYRRDGKIEIVPYIPIEVKGSDYYTTYVHNKTRLDILSYEYYGDPNYGWLIMQANPEYGSMEYEIPDKCEIRIPFPLDVTLRLYKDAINQYKELYG